MADLQQQVVPAAYDGIDHDSSPDNVPLTKAPIVENLLVDSPGKLPMRGPINARSIPLEPYPANIPIACWTLNNDILVSYKSGTAGLEPWVAPYYWWVSSDAELARASTAATQVALQFDTATRVTVTKDTAPGPRFAKLGSYVYGPAFDSASAGFQQGQRYVSRKLLKWGGSGAPTVVANAPDCAQDIEVHLNRVWLLGGRDIPSGVGSPPVEPSTLYYSVTGGPQAVDASTGLTAESANSWKDFSETTQNRPRTNKIVVGADDGDFGVGLAKVGRQLTILKRRSMYVLSGYDADSFNVQQFSDSVGCVDARSIVPWEDGVFFMSDKGFMYFDGSSLRNRTESLRSTVAAAIQQTLASINGSPNAFAVATRMPNDYIALTIGRFPDRLYFSGLYHVTRDAWCTFSSDALFLGSPIGFGRADTIPYLLDGGRIIRGDYVTAPAAAPAGTYGIDTLNDQFTWSLDPARTTFSGAADSLQNEPTQIAMFPSARGATFTIPARWKSRLFPLSSLFYRAQLHRVLVEYNAKLLSGGDSQAGWTVTVQSGDGDNLAAPYDVLAQGSPTAYPQRRINVRDNFSETSDAQIVVEWAQPPQPLERAEILSAALEFQQTSQYRNP